MVVFDSLLGDKTKKLIEKEKKKTKEKYVLHYYNESEVDFIEGYNIIKDKSWPECSSYDNFYGLPEHIQYECENLHHFSPKIYYDSIINDFESVYKENNHLLIKKEVESFLQRRLDIIEKNKIIDFACKSGKFSFFAHLNNATHVQGMDIRPENIQIAKSIQKDLQINDSDISFITSDIHNYTHNRKLCQNCDTAFVMGIMYHIHDHIEIMESIFDNNLQNIIIESGICKQQEPIIWWKKEFTFENRSGWYKNKNKIFVGYPTISWFDLIANSFGYEKTDQLRYDSNNSVNCPKKYIDSRAVLLYQKI